MNGSSQLELGQDADDVGQQENVIFRPFQQGDEVAFRELNEAWIAAYFTIEAKDREVLGDPVTQVLEPGGEIVMAVKAGQPVGCCALLAMDDGSYEVAKMTVTERLRGEGIGQRLLRYVIDYAKALGARRLYLETSCKLKNAIHVYESLGFRHLPPERIRSSPYVRADVYMELLLD
jgi:GNAT superfamily N-acetyltransferase